MPDYRSRSSSPNPSKGRSMGPTSTAVGLHLLPSELLHSILLLLPLPDLLRLRSLSRHLLSLISAPDFLRVYGSSPASSSPFLFLLFKHRRPLSSLLRGFDRRSGRWFSFPAVSDLLAPAVPPGEDLYLLSAAAGTFLFASNGLRQLIAVDLPAKTVTKIKDSPLGPRGTSSWRRPGLKLIPGPDRGFRFLFAEMREGRPVLFEYRSETDTWRCAEADEQAPPPRVRNGGPVYLNVVQNAVLCADGPVVYRPGFRSVHVDGGHRLHVYGDDYMAVIKSADAAVAGGSRTRAVVGVELWVLSSDGGEWDPVSRADEELVGRVNEKPRGAMMGCLEGRGGVVTLVLMSNCRGAWDLTWLNYDPGRGDWEWVPVPDCGAEGLNMAGIAISSPFAGF